MRQVILFLFFMLTAYAYLGCLLLFDTVPITNEFHYLAASCGVWGGIGGVLYCLRGVYLSHCVRDEWSERWLPWYYIRPFISAICGIVSCLFLKSGLFVLEAQQAVEATNIGFYALAFIAGLNVDKFIEKVEDIAQVTWGIKKSKATRESARDSEPNQEENRDRAND